MGYLNDFNYGFTLSFYNRVQNGETRKEVAEDLGFKIHMVAQLFRKYGFSTAKKGFLKGNDFGTRFKKNEWLNIKCGFCGKSLYRPKYKIEGRNVCFCSRSCRSKYYATFGEKHWNWKGGISDKWSKLHNSKAYREWRLKIWQRDFFKCYMCKQKQNRNNSLHAHHVKPKKDYPELILDLSNGVTLCRDCHVFLHSKRTLHRSRH